MTDLPPLKLRIGHAVQMLQLPDYTVLYERDGRMSGYGACRIAYCRARRTPFLITNRSRFYNAICRTHMAEALTILYGGKQVVA